MPKYRVQIDEIISYVVNVEADNETEAGEIAEMVLCESDDPYSEYAGFVNERRVIFSDEQEEK